MTQRMVFFVPTDNPVGGIAKVLDYAVHASRTGREVIFCCSDLKWPHLSSPLFKKPYFESYGSGIKICAASELEPQKDDIIFFTLPSSHERLCALYAEVAGRDLTFIHLLQNTRLSNTAFDNGYSYRLLSKPLRRICITQEVVDAVDPYVENKDKLRLIPHGFDFDAFKNTPEQNDPITLFYNTFKSDLAKDVASAYRKAPQVSSVLEAKKGVSWDELRQFYAKGSIFIASPLPEEGLYLPGLEAMAAGQLVIIPDAFGNRFYCDFGDNCIQVPYGDIAAYQKAIDWAIEHWTTEAFEMRKKGYEKSMSLGLDGEYKAFSSYLDEEFAPTGRSARHARRSPRQARKLFGVLRR